MFRLSQTDASPVSYGTVAASFPYWWVGYEINHMASGTNGIIYLAETGRLAHLFIFYPDNAGYVDSDKNL